jgi:hypothetical protein
LLGLGFGVFQFWITQLNAKKRRLLDLRYDSYKEFILLVDKISDTLNIEMTNTSPINIHGLISQLMNQVNRLSSSVNINKDYLFPGIHLKPEAMEIKTILETILRLTDEYRLNVEKASRDEKNIVEPLENIIWHNKIRDLLKELHNKKYEFYRVLRTYL